MEDSNEIKSVNFIDKEATYECVRDGNKYVLFILPLSYRAVVKKVRK